MSIRATISSELQRILDALGSDPTGSSIDEISARLVDPPARRTLQRRLAQLVADDYIARRGKAKAARYVATGETRPVQEEPGDVPLSDEARELRRQIRRPLYERQPVGYLRAFLETYRPNETLYLSRSLTDHLSEIGRVAEPDQEQPAGTYARQILDRLLIDLSWNSSRLEGNTYSLLETDRLLSMGDSAEGRPAFETQMLLNHKAAIEFLVESVEDIGFNSYTVRNLHALLADNLLADPAAVGRIRTITVGIGQTAFHPLEVPQLIEECFEQVLATAQAISNPFEQVFFVMVQLPYLQPFEDVNKRVSRLAANIPFIRQNLCPLSFIDCPQQAYVDGLLCVYELNRIELLRDVFVWAYERSAARYSAVRQSLGEPDRLRLRYRAEMRELVAHVVSEKMSKTEAAQAIGEWAKAQIAADEQSQFTAVVEAELLALHEGNFARYRVRPSEFTAWAERWRK